MLVIILLLLTIGGFTLAVLVTRNVNQKVGRITTPDGIQEDTYVELGGVRQYVQIRGENIRNPVVLFLHGGPGGPTAYLSFYYQRELEKKFTMVQWDQRGCGRSYFQGAKDEVPTTEQLLLDIDQLIDYLRNRFACEKIIVMGHSWGTMLGCLYIQKHADKVSGYIGISQCVSVWRGNLLSSEKAIKAAGDNKTARKLKALSEKLEHASSLTEINMRDYVAMKMYTQKLLRYNGMLSGGKTFWIGLTSPYFRKLDWHWFVICIQFNKLLKIQSLLMEDCLFNIDLNKLSYKYKVPMCFLCGNSDPIVPKELVSEYFKKIEAPNKKLYIIDDAGHNLFLEKTDEMCNKINEWYQTIKTD